MKSSCFFIVTTVGAALLLGPVLADNPSAGPVASGQEIISNDTVSAIALLAIGIDTSATKSQTVVDDAPISDLDSASWPHLSKIWGDLREVSIDKGLLSLSNWICDGSGETTYSIIVDARQATPILVMVYPEASEEDNSTELGFIGTSIDSNSCLDLTRVPNQPPEVSLVEALESHKFGSPYLASRIVGIYTYYGCAGSTDRPVWFIEVSGFPPVLRSDRHEGYTEWYTVVDATSGELIWTASGPFNPVTVERD